MKELAVEKHHIALMQIDGRTLRKQGFIWRVIRAQEVEVIQLLARDVEAM